MTGAPDPRAERRAAPKPARRPLGGPADVPVGRGADITDSLRRALTSSFGARLAMAVLNFALFWVLSHRLAPADLGGYSVLMNLFYLLQGLPLLGLSAPLARRAASEPGQVAREFTNALVFALPVGAVIALGLLVTARNAYAPALWWPFVCLALAMLPTAAILVIESTLLGCERMSLVARVQCIEALGRMVGAVAVVAAGYGLAGIFFVFLVWRLVALALYAWRAGLPRPSLAVASKALWRRNWAEVPVFLGIALASVVATRIDVIALGQWLGLEAAGIYAAAARLYEATLMLPTVAAMVLLPALARLFTQDRAQFGLLLERALRLALGGGFMVALAFMALAQPVIDWLYAPALAQAADVLRCLIVGAVLMTADQLLSSTMTAAQAQRDDLRTMVIGVASLGLLLWLLVPRLGVVGAAIAVPTALALRVGWRLRWAARTLEQRRLGADVARLLLCWLLAGTALAAALRVHPLAALAAGWSTYLLALRFTGLLSAWPWAGLTQLRHPTAGAARKTSS